MTVETFSFSSRGCRRGSFVATEMDASAFGFDFLFARSDECKECDAWNSSNLSSSWVCDRLCSGSHWFEAAPIIPAVFVCVTAILFGIPLLLFHIVRTVRRQIKQACTEYELDNCFFEERCENFQEVLSACHSPSFHFVQPFRWKAMHWVVWQFLNPIILSVLQRLADLGSDHCEIAIAIWNFTTLAVLCHVRPYRAQINNVSEIVLEVLNFGFGLVPMINEYFELSERALLAWSFIEIISGILVVIVFGIVEFCSGSLAFSRFETPSVTRLLIWSRCYQNQKEAFLALLKNGNPDHVNFSDRIKIAKFTASAQFLRE
jgi:hypothetical protein